LNDPQSLHNYLYTHADPVNGIDPSGEFLIGFGISCLISSKLQAQKARTDTVAGTGAITAASQANLIRNIRILMVIGYGVDAVLWTTVLSDYLHMTLTSMSQVFGHRSLEKEILDRYAGNGNVTKKIEELFVMKNGNMAETIVRRWIRFGHNILDGKMDTVGYCTAWVDTVYEKLSESDNEIRFEKVYYDIPVGGILGLTGIHAFVRVTIKEPGMPDYIFYVDNGFQGNYQGICFPDDVPGHWMGPRPYEDVQGIIDGRE
jgi:hypothetical protein